MGTAVNRTYHSMNGAHAPAMAFVRGGELFFLATGLFLYTEGKPLKNASQWYYSLCHILTQGLSKKCKLEAKIGY